MTYAIKYHPHVEGDLRIIAEIITEYSGPLSAQAILADIERTVLALAETPKTGSIRTELGAKVRAIPAGRKGVVVFEVDDSIRTVFVLAITYGGADWTGKVPRRKGG